MSDVTRVRLLIIGTGPAGLTAAIYGARAGLAPVVIGGLQPGGQLTITTDVENFPGFAEAVQGPQLMEEMRKQAERVGTRYVEDVVTALEGEVSPFTVRCDGGAVYRADSVIIATGAVARWLGLESEERFKGYGVSACATCDGFFFRGKRVAVVGGGDTAAEEALFLARHASRVTLIHRREVLRASSILRERLEKEEKVSFRWRSVVAEVVGEDKPRRVVGLRLRDVGSGEVSRLDVEGVFIAIGHDPATSWLRGTSLAVDGDGYVEVVGGGTGTSIAGIFAAGDVSDRVYRQAVTAAGMGCMAAMDAVRFLDEGG